MNNVDYLRDHLKKSPYVLKKMISFAEIDDIPLYELKNFLHLYEQQKINLSCVKLSLHDYNSFSELYKALKLIMRNEISDLDVDFSSLNLCEQEYILNKNNIKYECKDGWLVTYPKSYEDTKLIGPKIWCIVKSQSLWKSYNNKARHVVFFKKSQVVGCSIYSKKYKAFDQNDLSLDLEDILSPAMIKYLNINVRANQIANYMDSFFLCVACIFGWGIVLSIEYINWITIPFTCLIILIGCSEFIDRIKKRSNVGFEIAVVSIFTLSLMFPFFIKSQILDTPLLTKVKVPFADINIKFSNPFISFPNKRDYFVVQSAIVDDDLQSIENLSIKNKDYYEIIFNIQDLRLALNNKSYKVASYILRDPSLYKTNSPYLSSSLSFKSVINLLESRNSVEDFKFILNNDYLVNKHFSSDIFGLLLFNKDNLILRELLKYDYGINMLSPKSIVIALNNNNIEGVNILLDNGIIETKKNDIKFSQLLIAAIKTNDQVVIDRIYKKMLKLDLEKKPNLSVLKEAIVYKNIKIIGNLMLLDTKWDFDKLDKDMAELLNRYLLMIDENKMLKLNAII